MVKGLTDFQKDWEKIVDKGLRDYNSLTVPERVWFNIQSLDGQVCNGGLISFYWESTGDYVSETIEDLILIDAKNIVAILEKMNHLFPNGQPPKDFDKRDELFSNWNWTEEDSQLVEELDNEFFRNVGDLEKNLVEYILKNNLSS